MGATSVTGTGQGSASAGVKGPGNGRNHFVPQIGPHILAAGSGVLDSAALTVTLPSPLPGSESGYVVMVRSDTANEASISAKTDDSDGNFASFNIVGTGTDAVMWMVASSNAVVTTGVAD